MLLKLKDYSGESELHNMADGSTLADLRRECGLESAYLLVNGSKESEAFTLRDGDQVTVSKSKIAGAWRAV
jgi:hypothetical protein